MFFSPCFLVLKMSTQSSGSRKNWCYSPLCSLEALVMLPRKFDVNTFFGHFKELELELWGLVKHYPSFPSTSYLFGVGWKAGTLLTTTGGCVQVMKPKLWGGKEWRLEIYLRNPCGRVNASPCKSWAGWTFFLLFFLHFFLWFLSCSSHSLILHQKWSEVPKKSPQCHLLCSYMTIFS